MKYTLLPKTRSFALLWGADLAAMQLISKFNKGFNFNFYYVSSTF